MNSGIYIIKNIINCKIYVGSTKDFDKRKHKHFLDLKNGKHSSIKLQRAYNKYGVDNFVFEIIEKLPYVKDIQKREQFWIDSLKAKELGYNIADASFGDCLSNHPNKLNIIKQRTQTILNNIAKLSQEERNIKWGKSGELNGRWDPEKHMFCEICGVRVANSSEKKDKKYCSKHVPKSGISNPFYGKHHTEETREKISKKALEKYKDNDQLKQAISEKSKELWNDPGFRKKIVKSMSLSHIGKKHSEETKEKMSKAHKGRVVSEETRKKLKMAQIGRKTLSPLSRKKLSNTIKERHYKWYNNGVIVKRFSETDEVPFGFKLGRKLL